MLPKNCLTKDAAVLTRIKELGPQLILVENTVCGAARDALEHLGVALILNVKAKVLQRVARFLEVPIFESIGSMMTLPKLATCDMYRNELYELPNDDQDPKSLVIIEGGRKRLGCTILLRGGLRPELLRVKRVMQRMLIVRSNSRYEKAFLLNESASITTESKAHIVDVVKQLSLQELTMTPLVMLPARLHEVLRNNNMTSSDFSTCQNQNVLPSREEDRPNGVGVR